MIETIGVLGASGCLNNEALSPPSLRSGGDKAVLEEMIEKIGFLAQVGA
jgi:hypothetical protein